MASTAALMQAMQSFDSSVDATGQNQTYGGAGHMTAGGISLAPSFHSEDYDDDAPAPAARPRQTYRHEEESSLMEEEEMGGTDGGAEGDSGLSEEPVHQQYQQTRRTGSSSRADSAARIQSSSSRFPSASTAPTEDLPSPKRRPPIPSGVAADLARDDSSRRDDASVSAGQSAMLGELTVDDSRDSGKWGGQADGGRKKSGGGGMGQTMTLREQEKVIDEFKKENFDLKLKIHFYEQRLERLAPDHIDQALRENIQLKVEFQTLRTELKRYKKLLLEGNRAIESLTRERDQAQRGAAGSGSRREKDLDRELQRSRQDADTLDARLKEQTRELKELRDTVKRRKPSDLDSEDSRTEIARLRDELDAEREAREEALADQDDLRYQLREATDRLEEAQDDLERLRDPRRTDRGIDDSSAFGDRSRRDRGSEDGGKSRQQLERENDGHRDRASAHALEVDRLESELAKKEQEIEELLGDIDQRDLDHASAVKHAEDDWKGEVEEARSREAQMRDLLDEKENDIDELADKVESLMRELKEKEEGAAADAEEVEALTHDLQKLGAQIFALEEEADEKDNRIRELETELDGIDKEMEDKQAQHNEVVNALKEKLASTNAQLSQLTAEHGTMSAEHATWRDKIAQFEAATRSDFEAKRRLEAEATESTRALRRQEEERERERQDWARQRREEEAQWQRQVDAQNTLVQQAREDATQFKRVVDARERDLRALQDAYKKLEASHSRQGESNIHARSSLALEVDRLRRDMARSEQDLAAARRELEDKAARLKEEELNAMTLQSENKDLAAQLASQTQTRLALTDKYDEVTKDQRQWKSRVQTKQAELDSSKSLIAELQNQVSILRSTPLGSPGGSAKVTDLTARASKAERHLAATQAQLADAETKLGEAREKVAVAEGKWEARVKEYERLVKSLKEENKRLKQGAKERVSELEDFIQSLQHEKKRADHRKAHLDGVLDANAAVKQAP